MHANYYANGNNLQLLFNLAHVTYCITRSHTCQLITHHQHPTTAWDPNDLQHHLGIGIFYELTFFLYFRDYISCSNKTSTRTTTTTTQYQPHLSHDTPTFHHPPLPCKHPNDMSNVFSGPQGIFYYILFLFFVHLLTCHITSCHHKSTTPTRNAPPVHRLSTVHPTPSLMDSMIPKV